MRTLTILLIVCLVLVACKDNEITGKAIADVEGEDDRAVPEKAAPPAEQEKVEEEPKMPPREDLEENAPEQYEDVTDVKTYNVKGECTVDSMGVVRYFNENGRKTVYRDECDFGFIVEYDCEGNEVTSTTTQCRGECKRTPYGDVCQ